MCGRTACTLQPDEIINCCCYTNKQGTRVCPKWINQDQYRPSYNLGPSKYCPILTLENKGEDDRVIQNFIWGLNVHGTDSLVINARAETVLEKPTFKVPLKKGNRCVILADGYYEWRRQGQVKEPFFFHLTQEKGVCVYDETWSTQENKSPKLLAIAGIYDQKRGEKDEGKIGFVVITVKASSAVCHIHDRMPAILSSEEEISHWLECGKLEQAVSELKPKEEIEFYPVSTFVNNVKNNSKECFQPKIKSEEKPKTALEKWLKRSAPDDIKTTPSKQSRKT